MLCSYLSLFETASEACSSRYLSVREAPAGQRKGDGEVAYHAVTYGPVVPPECSETFNATIQDLYRIYKPPLPENATLMHGQERETGGENARPPPQNMLQAAPRKVQVCRSQHTHTMSSCRSIHSACLHEQIFCGLAYIRIHGFHKGSVHMHVWHPWTGAKRRSIYWPSIEHMYEAPLSLHVCAGFVYEACAATEGWGPWHARPGCTSPGYHKWLCSVYAGLCVRWSLRPHFVLPA